MANDKGVWDDLSESFKAGLKASPPAPPGAPKSSESRNSGGVWWIVAALVGAILVLAFSKGMTRGIMDYVWPKRAPSSQGTAAGKDLFAYDRVLQRAADSINAHTPRMLDGTTRLDRAQAGPGLAFTFHNTFASYPSGQVDRAAVEARAPELRQRACADAKLREFFLNRVVVTYAYAGNDGVPVASIVVRPGDCGF